MVWGSQNLPKADGVLNLFILCSLDSFRHTLGDTARVPSKLVPVFGPAHSDAQTILLLRAIGCDDVADRGV